MHKFIVLLLIMLSACAKGSRVVPALAFVLTVTPVFADTSFEATWDVILGDSSNIDYVLRVDSVTPPVVIYWTGRGPIVAGKMVHKFLLSSTKIVVTGGTMSICATVAAKDKTTGKESGVVFPAPCVSVDTSAPPPPIPSNFTFKGMAP